LKICLECEFSKESFGKTPDGQLVPNILCTSPECRDPVVGEPMPCSFARREQAFCGVQGKYFKLKEVKPAASILQLET